MNLRAFAAAVVVAGLSAGASSATAAVSVLTTEAWNLSGPLLYGQSMIQDYDNPLAAGFIYVGDNTQAANPNSYVRSGGLVSGVTAPPPVLKAGANPNNPQPSDIIYESTEYQTVANGGTASIKAVNKYFTSFSFYMGSPDAHNSVSFRLYDGDTLLNTLSGQDIWDGGNPNEDNGDQKWGYRIYYGFDQGDRVNRIEFKATGVAFEFDGLAATTAAIPEPATWTMMILGFGAAGAMLRSRRRMVAA